jgi:hypothetical protein
VPSHQPSRPIYHLLNLQHAVDRRGMRYQLLTATATAEAAAAARSPEREKPA